MLSLVVAQSTDTRGPIRRAASSYSRDEFECDSSVALFLPPFKGNGDPLHGECIEPREWTWDTGNRSVRKTAAESREAPSSASYAPSQGQSCSGRWSSASSFDRLLTAKDQRALRPYRSGHARNADPEPIE